MSLIFKHKNVAFSLSVSEIGNKDLKQKIQLALKDVFKGFISVDTECIALEFIFTDNINSFIVDKEFVRVKDVKVGKTQTYFKDGELDFLIDNSNKFKVYINVSDNETLKSSIRIFNKAFKNNIEIQITTFYYRIFLLFTQIWNVENNCSYVHASAIEVNGESILFTADSGVGKSTLLFKLSQDDNFKFIADDLTIISDQSESYYQGRCLSVKPYHLNFYYFLSERLSLLMSRMQKLQWQFLKDNRLTYRVSPNDLFASICEKSKIKSIIHLCNHDKDTFEIKNITNEELINFTIPILTNELFLANHKLNTLASLPFSPFHSTAKIYTASENIINSAFKNVTLKLVFVPYMSNPNDLCDFLKSEGCLN
jgi:hypothetical protein